MMRYGKSDPLPKDIHETMAHAFGHGLVESKPLPEGVHQQLREAMSPETTRRRSRRGFTTGWLGHFAANPMAKPKRTLMLVSDGGVAVNEVLRILADPKQTAQELT
jgi:hypothetical protein